MNKISDGKLVKGVGTISAALAGVVSPAAGATITILTYFSEEVFSKVNQRKQEELTQGYLDAANNSNAFSELQCYLEKPEGQDSVLEFCKKAVLTNSQKAIKIMGMLLYGIVDNDRGMTQKDFVVLSFLSELNDFDVDNIRIIYNRYEEKKERYAQGMLAEVEDIVKDSMEKDAVYATLKKMERHYLVEISYNVMDDEMNSNVCNNMFSGQFLCFSGYGKYVVELIIGCCG